MNNFPRGSKKVLLLTLMVVAVALVLIRTAPAPKSSHEPSFGGEANKIAQLTTEQSPVGALESKSKSSSVESLRLASALVNEDQKSDTRRRERDELAETSSPRERKSEREGGEEEEEERKQDEPDKAAEWRLQAMVDEKGRIPDGALVRAWNQAKQMPVDAQAWPVESSSASPIDPIAGINPSGWTWLGPGNIGGRLRSIVIHPTDPQTIWVGSVGGGIWKTTNGGASWSPMSDFLASIAVASMAIDPNNPNVLYVGTGEGFGNQDRIQGAGIFKTTDGGTTWSQLPATANSSWYWVNRLAINPTNSQIILAATLSGTWRTTDGGATWSQRFPAATLDLNFDPNNPNKAVASGTGSARYSVDGGFSWALATGLPSGGRIEVAYAPSDSSIVYASAETGSGQLYRSTDGGVSYTLVNSGTNFLGTQGWYDNVVWVDPTNANTLFVGGINLWRSTNGGTTLSVVGSLHTDHHAIVESPQFNGSSNKTVYFGNDGGIGRTTDSNAVVMSTVSLNNNLGVTQFYAGAGNASSGTIIGGTQDNGTLRHTAGGGTIWSFMNGGDGGWSASDPTDPNYFYGEFQWLQLHRSSNGGNSSISIYNGITDAVANGPTNFIAPFILDPNNPNTLLAGGASLWRTTNAKGAVPLGWTTIKSAIGSNISAIAVAKGNSDIIWVGHNNGTIFMTTNGTSASPTWTQVDNNSPGVPNRRINRITIDPTSSRMCLCIVRWIRCFG